MKLNYKLSKKVKDYIFNCELTEICIGCSASQVFKIKKNNNIYFLKIAKLGLLTNEYHKLKWLCDKLIVPKIVLYDINEDVEYLITEAIYGEMICSKKYCDNPELGLQIIAEAFKNIYLTDIKDCPFDVSIDYKLSLVENNVRNKLIDENQISEANLSKFGNIENILAYLRENKFYDDLCFSHGDTSLPNIFGDNENFSGFIDVGESGMADKWFDLAICEKSIIRNYGQQYVNRFYELLNIKPERHKIDYYLLMMELYL